jgi:peptidoglycan/xylan/chitin deacetylase (PgdA/CDA1 family)
MLVVLAALTVLAIAMTASGRGAHAAAPPAGQAAFFRVVRVLAGTGKGSLAAGELATQNAAINRTLAYTPYVRIAGRQHREMALTFDDGPGPYTSRILSILERKNVPATFFEVGVAEEYFHTWTDDIVAHGYPIGDHTFSHPPMSSLSARDQQAQLLEQATAIKQYGAPFPRLFRPPYGMWNSTTLRLLHKYRMLMVLWSVDTNDYRRPGVAAIVSAALLGARPGAIILLHDAGGDRSQTVLALPKIIAGLRDRGYRLVTVPQLLVDNPPPANQQISSVIGSGG